VIWRAPSEARKLTEAGHVLIETTVRQLLDHEADLIGTLTADERAALTGFLAKLEQALTGPGPRLIPGND